MDPKALFWKMHSGALPLPEAVKTLGGEIIAVDADKGTVETCFQADHQLCNPVGMIQGGFLAAMLDDTMGPALAATLQEGEFAPTLTLTVQYLRGVSMGPIKGFGRIVRRGKSVCHLSGELLQNDRIVATATAVAVVQGEVTDPSDSLTHAKHQQSP